MQKKPITKTQFDLLILAARVNKRMQKGTKEKLMCAYTLLYHTACRIDEIRLFTREDLQTLSNKGELVLPKERTKSKRARIIRASDKGREEIAKIAGSFDGFKSAKGGDMSKASFKRLLNTHIQAVLGEHYSSHSFRAGAATRLCEKGLLKAAQIHLGHANAATTLIYQRLSEKDLQNALNSVY